VPAAGPVAATIVVTPDPEPRDGTITAVMENAPSEDVTPAPEGPDDTGSLDALQPARPLPRKTSRRRRNTSK
jgi:hypothetical protein